MRPYHGSDLELVLAQARGNAYQDMGSEIEKAGLYIRNAVASFVRDPVEGLTSFGWPRYDYTSSTLVKLFGDESAVVSFEDARTYDAACQYL